MKKNDSPSIKVRSTSWILLLASFLVLAGCSSLVLTPIDYSWLVESRLTTDANGFIKGDPRSFQGNLQELFFAEEGPDSSARLAARTINIIRDRDGYYFITSPGFKHVYVFASAEGALRLTKKVLIIENGMESPYFNYRAAGIELNANGQEFLLNKSGMIAGGHK